jgi:hypothetical protein
MTINYTTNLSLAEPVTGTESGTWGDDVNKGLTDYLDIAIAGTLALTSSSFTAGALTLANTTGNNTSNGITTTTAQYYVLKVSSLTASVTITAPSASKSYIVVNNDPTYTVTIKASGQTGVTIAVSSRALVVFNGTDYQQVGASAGGSTTQVQYNNAGALAGSSTFTFNSGTNTVTIGTLNLTNALGISYGGTGQTTASAAFNALSPITTTGDLILGNGTNSATRLAIGANTYILTSNGTTASWQAPTAGVSLSAANTWTATQTFNGTSSTFGATLLDSNETVNIVSAAPSSTTNFYIQSGAVQYYTSNAANNWTLNIAFSSGTSLNTALSTGQSVTFTLVTTQGSTAYYNNAVTIDGTAVTPKWIGGAPSAGNASGLDVYRFAVVKTGSATYTVLASLTQYK